MENEGLVKNENMEIKHVLLFHSCLWCNFISEVIVRSCMQYEIEVHVARENKLLAHTIVHSGSERDVNNVVMYLLW